VIIDGTDNFASRYLINDACFFAKKSNIHASILQFSGQISVFCSPSGPCYRCLFPSQPPADAIPNCAEGGVFGVLPGLLGVMQATEALKIIVGCGEPLINRLLNVNTLNMEFDLFSLNRNPDCALCGDNPTIKTLQMLTPTCKTSLPDHNIDAITLRQQLQQNPDLVLIDVREPYELEIISAIGNAINIPLNTLPDNLNKLPRTAPFVVYCKSGGRSLHATQFLREQGFDCQNLSGGIEKW
jgi:rhodanese-related sulfurtransferase